MGTLSNYKGSVTLISGLTPKNGLDMPLMEAHDIMVAEDGTRLDAKLLDLEMNGGSGSGGVSITNIRKTGTDGLVDTYTIYLSNNNSYTFTVTNGRNGTDGTDGMDGAAPKFKCEDNNLYVSYNNGSSWSLLQNIQQGVDGKDGKDGTDGRDGVDGKTPSFRCQNNKLEVSYDNGSTWQLLQDIQNGIDGKDGKDGTNGKDGVTPTLKAENNKLYVSYNNGSTWSYLSDVRPGANGTDGKDGLTPYIGENKNWWIGEIDLGVRAEGRDATAGSGLYVLELTDTEGTLTDEQYAALVANAPNVVCKVGTDILGDSLGVELGSGVVYVPYLGNHADTTHAFLINQSGSAEAGLFPQTVVLVTVASTKEYTVDATTSYLTTQSYVDDLFGSYINDIDHLVGGGL